MPTDPRRAPRPRGSRRASLRRAALRLGAALGWPAAAVVAFAEALTGAPWARCDEAELQRVERAFCALLRTAGATVPRTSAGAAGAARRGAQGPQRGQPATGDGGGGGGARPRP
jgi:hypothetical protein